MHEDRGGGHLEILTSSLEEWQKQGQPLRLPLALQAQADMAPSQPHNPTGLCREESPPGTPIAVTSIERRAHIDTGASVSVIVTQPGKLLQCAIPSSRAVQWQQQAWGGGRGGAVLLPEEPHTQWKGLGPHRDLLGPSPGPCFSTKSHRWPLLWLQSSVLPSSIVLGAISLI